MNDEFSCFKSHEIIVQSHETTNPTSVRRLNDVRVLLPYVFMTVGKASPVYFVHGSLAHPTASVRTVRTALQGSQERFPAAGLLEPWTRRFGRSC